jgi:hypothetical protein
MDPLQLLDPNTPFDENKLNILETIVTTFYKTSNQNEVRKIFIY